MAETLADAGITESVETALAADPAPSACKIDVSTHRGEAMPAALAPDASAHERAAVLADAPDGVRGVDYGLVVAPMLSSAVASVASADRS